MGSKLVEATFRYIVYSPKGEIEGAILENAGGRVQIVFDKHDDAAGAAFLPVDEGQTVSVDATLRGPSPKGDGEHPVFAYRRLVAIDGKKPMKPKAASAAAYRGTVVRLNYARHGAANGVVLDTGDFIHTKPEGMAKLKLKVGDEVRADGDAHRLATDQGWAVEATRVNGKTIHPA